SPLIIFSSSSSPPATTPFPTLPYTTLFRSWVRAAPGQLEHASARLFFFATNRSTREQIARLKIASADGVMRELLRNTPIKILERSEEHTSELQSPDHLVCRLLLEKKKT